VWPERIEVLVKEQLAQGVRRMVRIDEGPLRVHGRGGFVESRDDAIRDVLLPVSGRIAGRRARRLSGEALRRGETPAERERAGEAAPRQMAISA
jgi:hypothetical protein